MKRVTAMNLLLLSLALTALVGCVDPGTHIYDPNTTYTGIRNSQTISSEEMKIVAHEAVQNAMSSPRFLSFLQQYRAETGNEYARPILKLAKVANDTSDPDLNVDELTDVLSTELMNAGYVDVTLAEGTGRVAEIAGSRDLEYDDNFDQSTVAKRGTLQAARLIMHPKVISNMTRDGHVRDVVRTFTIEMVDIKTGVIMWKYNKQLGFVKTRPTVGR